MNIFIKLMTPLFSIISILNAMEDTSDLNFFNNTFDLQHLVLIPTVEANLFELGHSVNLERVCKAWHNWIPSRFFQNMLTKDTIFVMTIEDYNNERKFQTKRLSLTTNASLTHISIHIPENERQFRILLQEGLTNKPRLKNLTFFGDLYITDLLQIDKIFTENDQEELKKIPHLQCFSTICKLMITGCLRGTDNHVSFFKNTFINSQHAPLLTTFQWDIFNNH